MTTLDVREDIRAGREPFSKIVAAVAGLSSEENLLIIAPFEPVPLFRSCWPNKAFLTSLSKPPQAIGSCSRATEMELRQLQPSGLRPMIVDVMRPESTEILNLDARGLEPPQPLITILEAISTLPPVTGSGPIVVPCISILNSNPVVLRVKAPNKPMEASLPISAAVRPAPLRPTVSAASFGANAPAIKLPLAFMLTGLLALAIGAAWLVFRPSMLAAYHYNQNVIALTHLFVSGWLCSIVMGGCWTSCRSRSKQNLQETPRTVAVRISSRRLHRHGLDVPQMGHETGGPLGSADDGRRRVCFAHNIARNAARRVSEMECHCHGHHGSFVWISLTVIAGLSIAAGNALQNLSTAARRRRRQNSVIGHCARSAVLVAAWMLQRHACARPSGHHRLSRC